ncbi:hypothetical protein NDU88_004141 [Pleurodeles waltl]|uniref:Secreted protein n=1 Tax=Pleurodeles waltl TaxID=8319 RepID=A0AAV7UGA7_PLEWA|nr:hypothetical protein NDU88_004141 [Pleurodeles waltl]
MRSMIFESMAFRRWLTAVMSWRMRSMAVSERVSVEVALELGAAGQQVTPWVESTRLEAQQEFSLHSRPCLFDTPRSKEERRGGERKEMVSRSAGVEGRLHTGRMRRPPDNACSRGLN